MLGYCELVGKFPVVSECNTAVYFETQNSLSQGWETYGSRATFCPQSALMWIHDVFSCFRILSGENYLRKSHLGTKYVKQKKCLWKKVIAPL